MRPPRILISLVIIFLLAFLTIGCGESSVSIATVSVNALDFQGTTIPLGNHQSFNATVTTSSGQSPANSTVTWSSSNTAVFRIDGATGGGDALSQGSTVITATVTVGSSQKTGSFNLTVGPAVLKSINVTPVNPSRVAGGANVTFTAAGVMTDGSPAPSNYNWAALNWSSSNTGVATINSTTGIATLVAAGTTTVKATNGAISGSTTLTITAPLIESIAITPANPSIAVNSTQPFVATATYNNSTTADITSTATWASSKTEVATLAGARATGVSAGETIISASQGGVTGSTQLTVTTANVTAELGWIYALTWDIQAQSSKLKTFAVNAEGSLSEIGSITLGFESIAYTIDPSYRFLYTVAEGADAGITGFAIDRATGALTAITGTPFQTAHPKTAFVKVDPTGRFLYAFDNEQTGFMRISVLSIDQQSGALTNTGLATNVAINGRFGYLCDFAETPTQAYLYAATGGVYESPTPWRQLHGFVVDPQTGVLSELSGSPYQTLSPQTFGIAVGDDGVVYLAFDAFRITSYPIQSASGVLSIGSMFGPGQGLPVQSFAKMPWGFYTGQGQNLLAVNYGNPLSQRWTVNTSHQIWTLQVDPNRRFLFVGHQDGIATYQIQEDGTVTAGPSVSATQSIARILFMPRQSNF